MPKMASSSSEVLSNVSVPMKLDAFIFNQDVCDGTNTDARIAPITQPNYTFLRIDENHVLQNDVLDHVDPHNSIPYKHNPRFMDLGSMEPRTNRIGVYLHWILPRFYRSGQAATGDATRSMKSTKLRSEVSDTSAPSYLPTPNRWLVIRKLDPKAQTTLPSGSTIKPVEAWIIQSDLIQMLDNIDQSVDLQTDVTPFITSVNPPSNDAGDISLVQQAETFIGTKSVAEGWTDPGSPAVNLSLLSSSNQLFPDYQPHNSNVFSMIDNFNYYDGKNNLLGSLTDAVADYYVLGWHQNSKDDPFTLHGNTRQAQINNLSMTLQDSDIFNDWLTSTLDTRVICHGAMYNVEWHSRWSNGNRPSNTPADDFTSSLISKMPVSVGTTSMDALLSYLELYAESDLEKKVAALGALLRAQDDSTTGQQAGTDEVQNYNFSRQAGGSCYKIPISQDSPATAPPEEDQMTLNLLNLSQALLDGASRMLEQKRWETFALWWRYVTDYDTKDQGRIADFKDKAGKLDTDRTNLLYIINSQLTDRNDYKSKLEKNYGQLKEALNQDFNQQRDPTLFIDGLNSGWPLDFLDLLRVRLDEQIATYGQPDGGDSVTFCTNVLPSGIQATALALVKEFVSLSPTQSSPHAPVPPFSAGQISTYPPLYHDQGPPDAPQLSAVVPWRDRWEQTQPWFPLFIEWEVDYYHVEWSNWTLTERTARLDKAKNLRYGLDDTVKYNIEDHRTLSGRIILLPQPSFSLQGQLQQLFNSTPSSILAQYGLDSKEAQASLLKQVTSLPFASAPLDGFLNHLSTKAVGGHLKPNVRVPGDSLIALKDAYTISSDAGLGKTQVEAIETNSDLTPYGTLVIVEDDTPAYKPATHGQFKFTKLNIIDKFGQVACAIDPTPLPGGATPSIYPCISTYYEPQLIDDKTANVIIPQPPGACEFMQISTQINQSARLNVAFVVSDTTQSSAYWRPIRDWENPVWGWLVVNYVDQGIQFFAQDGSFYREVRVASPNNPHSSSAGQKWLPFPPGQSTSSTKQLDQLIAKMTDTTNNSGAKYTEAFIKMVTQAVGNSATAPNAYSQFVNSLVGKPLALVNAGFSLELAYNSESNQSFNGSQQKIQQPWGLLQSDVHSGAAAKQYSFPFKLGDHNRLYDGLIGYFEAKVMPVEGDELEMGTVFTSYIDPDPPTVQPIDTSTFHELRPFWLDPATFLNPVTTESSVPEASTAGQDFDNARNLELNGNIFGCIVDPFLPLNIYSSLLPVIPLTLPPWTWETALKSMTAFFHFGPLLVPNDVPQYNADFKLKPTYTSTIANDSQLVPDSAVQLPSVKVADWTWLQPYQASTGSLSSDAPGDDSNLDGGEELTDGSSAYESSGGDVNEAFMALRLGQMDSKPRYEPGPYTALEGYLQMRTSIEVTQP